MTTESVTTEQRAGANSASLLGAIAIISGALYDELKDLSAGLNAFSDAPSGNPISPSLSKMHSAAAFCGFWGVANYLSALAELSFGIESNPPLLVDRTEYIERIKTLAIGMNALGVHLRDINMGGIVSYSELNDQFGKVIRKARPALLEVTPELSAPLMFMPVPPSLEIESHWASRQTASNEYLLQALAECLGTNTITPQLLRDVADTNPYRTLSGLFETAACLPHICTTEILSDDVKREYKRIHDDLKNGLPVVPPAPDCYLFSRLLFALASGDDNDEPTSTIRTRYALIKPKSGGQAVISMHDIARKFALGMLKFRDLYLQASLTNTPYVVKNLAATVHADSAKLASPAFSIFAAELHKVTTEWSSNSDLGFKEWTYGAALVLMLRESAENWSCLAAQNEMSDLANLMVSTGKIHTCQTMQSFTRVVALQKSCTAILSDSVALKQNIEGSLLSLGDSELLDSQATRLVEVLGPKCTNFINTVKGFCICVAMPVAADFSCRLLHLTHQPDQWKNKESRALIFDGLSRLSLFIGRLRPSSLIDIQDDEMGNFADTESSNVTNFVNDIQDAGESVNESEINEVQDLIPSPVPPELTSIANDTEISAQTVSIDAHASVLSEFSSKSDGINALNDEIIPPAHEIIKHEDDALPAETDNSITSNSIFDLDNEHFYQPPTTQARVIIDPQTLLSSFLNAAEGCEDKLDRDDSELISVMFDEAEQCLTDIGRCITVWFQEENPSLLIGTVAEARRHMHTLKGAARLCGLTGLGSILHAMEDDLEVMPDDGIAMREQLSAYIGAMTAVRDRFDKIRSEYELAKDVVAIHEEPVNTTVNQQSDSDAQSTFLTAEVLDTEKNSWASTKATQIDTLNGIVSDPVTTSAELDIESLAIELKKEDIPEPIEIIVSLAGPSVLVDAQLASRAPTASILASKPSRADLTVRVPLDLATNVGRASGQVMMASRRSLEGMDRTMRNLREVEGNLKRMAPVLRELDIMASASISASSGGGGGASGFDALELDRYTVLQELVRRLKEAFEDSVGSTQSLADGLRSTHNAEQERAQLSDDLQRESSELLLVSVATQRTRLERVVSKACEDTKKSVSLVIDPRCRVPAAALDKLMAVFEHLLRNAVAHGIETPEKRLEAGKPRTGIITIGIPLAINQDGSVVRLSIRDDGAGIDHANVLAMAQKRGLALRGEKYSDIAIREFLFMPGFSTSSSVNQLAGRGVGLDVVRSAIATLGGMVSASSKSSEGAEFTLTLPADISSMSVVPVSARGYKCLLPLTLVTRIVPVSNNLDVVMNEAAGNVSVGGELLDLIDLASRVQAIETSEITRHGRSHLVLMRESEVTRAVLVDSVGSQTRMVVRPLGPYVKDIPGMVAGTTLSNGDAGLVVNPLRLQEITVNPKVINKPSSKAKHVMVVDDSSTVRLVTAKFLRRLGYEVTTAGDGLEALRALTRGSRPDGFLFDLEMPGMGGYELISEIRRTPEYKITPIVIISSRTAEKHRERARELGASAYLTKPYEDLQLQEVLENLVGFSL